MSRLDEHPGPPPRSRLSGRLCVLGAALLWSSSGFFAKNPIFEAWPEHTRGTVLAFWRALFAAMILVPAIRQPRWRPGLVPLAACFTLMNVFYLTAMARTTAANAIWLQYTSPWWVFIFSVVFAGEPIVRRDLIPLAFGTLGAGMILAMEFSGADRPAQIGAACGLAAGVSYAAVVVLMRRLRREDPAWLVALNHGVAMLVLLPFVAVGGLWPTAGQLGLLAGFGILQMAIPYLLLIRGLRAISSQEAVAIGMLEPVLVPLWTYLAWGEAPAWWTIVGAMLILAGLVLRYVVWELLVAARPAEKTPRLSGASKRPT
ncbi:MAG: DMT family transporter [Thermoguttaceae bacterium]